jgi:ferredoxin
VTYVISGPCIGTKDTSCVEVCPVDCIHPTPDEADFEQAEQLYIDPEECIDCDACVETCPVDAITPVDVAPVEWRKYVGSTPLTTVRTTPETLTNACATGTSVNSRSSRTHRGSAPRPTMRESSSSTYRPASDSRITRCTKRHGS